MSSIFERAMGAREFAKLHPKLQERFSVGLEAGRACVGTGVMRRIWRGAAVTRPFLRLGTARNILFPETGTDVPFTIENWPYVDRAGRETVSFTRTFELPRVRRRFDATMVYDDATDRLVDYLGTCQHVAADLQLTADDRGGLLIRSTGQRIRLYRPYVKLPAMATGHANVRESYDDAAGMFSIQVRVENRWLGPIFGYEGSFTVRYLDLAHAPTPASVKPAREEHRM